MFKKFLGIVLCISSLVFNAGTIHAEGEFLSNVKVEYRILANGTTQVIHQVSLENLFSNLYATTYTLILDNVKPLNIRAYQDLINLPLKLRSEGQKTYIEVSFPDAVVGKGKIRIFDISFDNQEIATRTGEVWEIAIPKLSPDTSFNTYDASLSVPETFGQEAYISPNPVNKSLLGGRYVYNFDKASLLKTGITAGFGSFQVFSFRFIYHLENPLSKISSVEIALPPDSSLQKIYYRRISPDPENVRVDEDGNWLAKYLLTPRARFDVEAAGSVQIFSTPRVFLPDNNQLLDNYLKPTAYWQANDPAIITLASNLKTPKRIYDYVANFLTYNDDRAKPNAVRLGAAEALRQPKNAICTEYTDLFIALARAAGVPAREINGFAYTENSKIQPLSLVADVLHSWPEYWDAKNRIWVSIDPTWGSTTGGIDFFNKLDLRHFAFVIHGSDPQKPYPPGSYKLGPNPQKDVFVNFGQLPVNKSPAIQIAYEIAKFIPFSPQKINVFIKNNGPAAAYNLPVEVSFGAKSVEKTAITVLPPFSSYKKTLSIPFTFLGTKTPETVLVSAGSESALIPTDKKYVIIYNLAVIFIIFLLCLFALLLKTGKLKLRAAL